MLANIHVSDDEDGVQYLAYKDVLHSKASTSLLCLHADTYINFNAGSGELDNYEIVNEFKRIGLSAEEAKNIMRFHSNPSKQTISQEVFLEILVHVLEHAVHALSVSDVVTIAYLFKKHDSNKDGKMVCLPSRKLFVS